MNREQTVQADLKMQQYMERNKLRAIFTELTKQVVLKQPDDPLAFMIQYLSKRSKRQIICIQGYHHTDRTRISTAIANKFNYKHINVSDCFPGDYNSLPDNIINTKVLDQLNKTQSVYKGIVVSGYPCNFIQCDFLQKSNILPDRYFLLSTATETGESNWNKIQEQYNEIYKDQPDKSSVIQKLMARNTLQNKQMQQVLGNMIDFLPPSLDNAIQKISKTVNLKAKKIIPYDSPRVLVLHPPYLKPSSLNKIVDQYSLHWISIEKALKSLSGKKNFQNYVEKYIRQNKKISKQLELALIETECKSAAAKNKGYVISGWPCQKTFLPYLKEHFLNPHLIFIFTTIQEKAIDQFNNLPEIDAEIFAINSKPSQQDFVKAFKQYESVVEMLKNNNNVQILPLQQSDVQSLKTFESLIENAKIYH